MSQPLNPPASRGIHRCIAIAFVSSMVLVGSVVAEEPYESKLPDALFGSPSHAASANAGLSLAVEDPAIPDAPQFVPPYPTAPELPVAEEVEQQNDPYDLDSAEQQIIGPVRDTPVETPSDTDATTAALPVENTTITRGSHVIGGSKSDRPWYASGVVPMALVLGAIGVITLLIRKYAVGSKLTGGEVLNVLCRTHISPKQSIALVQMGGRMVFVGISAQQISTLRTVEDREEVLTLRSQLRIGGKTAPKEQFDQLLSGEENRIESVLEPIDDASAENAEKTRRTRDDLNELLDRLRTRRTRGNPSAGNARRVSETKS
jgi:flagellar biogenesis protein FliO